MNDGFDLTQAKRAHAGRPALGGSGISPRIQVRVDPGLAHALQARARDERRSLSEVARTALREYVERARARTGEPPVDLPGAELVRQGLADLRDGRVSEASLLLLIAAPRLRAIGIAIPGERQEDGGRQEDGESPEHRLYSLLANRLGGAAHSRYNALLARIASFASAAEHAATR